MSRFRLMVAIVASIGLHTLILFPMILNAKVQGESAAARLIKITLRAKSSPESQMETIPEEIPDVPTIEPPTKTTAKKNSKSSRTVGESDSSDKRFSSSSDEALQNSSVLETSPKPTIPIVPNYPMLARKTGLRGTVVLDVDVDSKGKPLRYRAVLPSSHPILENAAANAAMNALYTPGTRNGLPIPSVLRLRVIFKLDS